MKIFKIINFSSTCSLRFQIWDYIYSHNPAVFYYATRSDRISPHPSIPTVDARALMLLSGPAMQYRRDIIVCTHSSYDLPIGTSIHVVRLRR